MSVLFKKGIIVVMFIFVVLFMVRTSYSSDYIDGIVISKSCYVSHNSNDIMRLLVFNRTNGNKAKLFSLSKLKSGEFKILKPFANVKYKETHMENVKKVFINNDIYYAPGYTIFEKKP